MAISSCCRSDVISVLDIVVVADDLPQYTKSAEAVEVSSFLVDISLCTQSVPECCSDARYTLTGEIQTDVGKYTAKQKLFEVVAHSQHSTSLGTTERGVLDDQTSELQAVDIAFRVPVSVGKQIQSYPTPGRYAGATFITEHSALSDQHAVEGRCSIVYYLRAERVGSQQAAQIVDLPKIAWPLNTYDLKSTASTAKTSKYTRAHQFLSRSLSMAPQTTNPTMKISVPQVSAKFNKNTSRSKANTHVLKMPITFSIELPNSATSDMQTPMHSLMSSNGLSNFASVDAQWNTKQKFGVPKPSDDHEIFRGSRVVIGKAMPMNMPPMYTIKTETGTTYTGTIDLVLVIPDQAAPSCTYKSTLLSNSYEISLQISTRSLKGQGMASLPAYSTKLDIDCNLR